MDVLDRVLARMAGGVGAVVQSDDEYQAGVVRAVVDYIIHASGRIWTSCHYFEIFPSLPIHCNITDRAERNLRDGIIFNL